MRAHVRFALALLGPFFCQGAIGGEAVSYPRVVGSGENASLEYGPGPVDNMVGGGAVTNIGRGEETEARYLDGQNVQAARRGMVPVTRGSGESTETVWVPAGPERAMTAERGSRN